MWVHMYVCMHACMHSCMHASIPCIYVLCMYVCRLPDNQVSKAYVTNRRLATATQQTAISIPSIEPATAAEMLKKSLTRDSSRWMHLRDSGTHYFTLHSLQCSQDPAARGIWLMIELLHSLLYSFYILCCRIDSIHYAVMMFVVLVYGIMQDLHHQRNQR